MVFQIKYKDVSYQKTQQKQCGTHCYTMFYPVIYTLFYFLGNTDDLFSKDMVSKAREIMSYDINFDEIYKRFINWLNSNNLFMNKAENEITNSILTTYKQFC